MFDTRCKCDILIARSFNRDLNCGEELQLTFHLSAIWTSSVDDHSDVCTGSGLSSFTVLLWDEVSNGFTAPERWVAHQSAVAEHAWNLVRAREGAAAIAAECLLRHLDASLGLYTVATGLL